MACYLADSKYGKDKVRVFRVVKNDKVHQVVEYNVRVLLEGDLEKRQARFSFRAGSILKKVTAIRRRITASSSQQIR